MEIINKKCKNLPLHPQISVFNICRSCKRVSLSVNRTCTSCVSADCYLSHHVDRPLNIIFLSKPWHSFIKYIEHSNKRKRESTGKLVIHKQLPTRVPYTQKLLSFLCYVGRPVYQVHELNIHSLYQSPQQLSHGTRPIYTLRDSIIGYSRFFCFIRLSIMSFSSRGIFLGVILAVLLTINIPDFVESALTSSSVLKCAYIPRFNDCEICSDYCRIQGCFKSFCSGIWCYCSA